MKRDVDYRSAVFATLYVIVAVLLGVLAFIWSESAHGVEFGDERVEAAVRKELNLGPDAPLGRKEMQALERLTLPGCSVGREQCGIRDLTGLEFAVNLRVLSIASNWISDLSPLYKLPLIEFRAGNNRIEDLSPLSRADGLQIAYFQNNLIKDIAPLSQKPELVHLVLEGNMIESIQPLADSRKLTQLNIEFNQVKDLWACQRMTEIHKIYARNNQITDLLPLVLNLTFEKGDTISITDNPLSHHAITRQVPILESRNANVNGVPEISSQPPFKPWMLWASFKNTRRTAR